MANIAYRFLYATCFAIALTPPKKHPILYNSSSEGLLNLLETTQDAFYHCYNNMYHSL